MLRYMTAGESHGKYLVAILEGMVAGLKVNPSLIDAQLKRRQSGYGRGGRMAIESDRVEIVSGLRKGVTIGSPITLLIANKDHSIDRLAPVTCVRPGHADLAASMKYDFNDARSALERASARETAARTALGTLCRIFLAHAGISLRSRVVMIGGIEVRQDNRRLVRERIDTARHSGDTLGGVFEIEATGLIAGLGSSVAADRKLDARLCGALMSIQAIKGVEVGIGFIAAREPGSHVHDAIFYDTRKGFYRTTNNAGGIEGGISNGEPLMVRCAMKPISTLMKPLASVDIRTKKPHKAAAERSDICAVEAAAVVAEAVTAFELANAFLEKFGGDSLSETLRNFKAYRKQIKKF
ncbi:MAG: chorismate synthase [Candidatus Omnitrophota bacterium]